MKKTLVSLILLMVFAGTLFFIGWIQFAVPAGKYGVLLSKSGGINPETILPSQFRWQWEKIIPTNSEVLIFDILPFTCKTTVEGILPSGNIYNQMLEGQPDFSWKIDLAITARLVPRILPELAGQFHIRDQKTLDSWAEAKITDMASEAGRSIINTVMQNSAEYPDFASNPEILSEMLAQKIAEIEQQSIEILSISPDLIRIPDFSLYSLASNTFTEYQQRRSTLLSKTATAEAGDSVSEYLQIERFVKLGEVLTKYPILIDYLAVTGANPEEAFKTLKSLR